ncbi:MAG: M3 family oligoendopeptidase [bacterium]
MPSTDTTTKPTKAPRWDLESIFPGGSDSKEYADFHRKVKTDLTVARERLAALPKQLAKDNFDAWRDLILEFQRLGLHRGLVGAFARCLISQDVADQKGFAAYSEAQSQYAEWLNLQNSIEAFAAAQSNEIWQEFLSQPEIKPISFYLNELRQLATEKMAPELESLALDLAVDGYHAWGSFYDRLSGEIKVDFAEPGKLPEPLSVGQLANKFLSPDREVRKSAFTEYEKAWETRAGLAADTLNNQAGFRLTLYKRRGWKSALHEPLQMGRMQEQTLDAMWSAVRQSLPQMKRYIDAKKKLLGIDKFCWFDQMAPVGELDISFNYGDAGKFIIKHLGSFSKELAEFAALALEKNWIEAEDRSGKADGGFCIGMNLIGQSRIFMTYSDDFGSMTTLAHELGHAYHQWVLKDTPFLSSIYPMGLAESASIFNELLVTDAALKEVANDKQKLMLLDQILQQPFILFCNIYARFLFDTSFYKERANGVVARERLAEMMLEAQKAAFGDILDRQAGLHPLFWASKLHFFITDMPFYNFPYTIGYLFAGGIYDRAVKEGSAFAPKYRQLLEDTGRMTLEGVAAKHLGLDLTKPDFWSEAVERSVVHVDEFVKLASQQV